MTVIGVQGLNYGQRQTFPKSLNVSFIIYIYENRVSIAL